LAREDSQAQIEGRRAAHDRFFLNKASQCSLQNGNGGSLQQLLATQTFSACPPWQVVNSNAHATGY